MFSQETLLATQCKYICNVGPMLLVLVLMCWALYPDPSKHESERVPLAALFMKSHKAVARKDSMSCRKLPQQLGA